MRNMVRFVLGDSSLVEFCAKDVEDVGDVVFDIYRVGPLDEFWC